MNRFRFLNVGQGLFYHGKIGDFNFVYDCGSTSPLRNQYLNNCIQSEFLPKEDIEYVFISHLDEDHINGYKFLRSYANVRRLILPYLGKNKLFVYLFLMILCNEDEELFDHIYVQYLEFEQRYDVYDNYLSIRTFREKEWIFNCFSKFVSNSIVNTFITDVANLISKSLGRTVVLDKTIIRNYVNSYGFKGLKLLYKKYFITKKNKSLNITSMCLLHHPNEDFENVSLLTGDAEFDQGMINYVNNYIGNHLIRYFQVPHHGAINEWKLLNGLEKNACFFI